MSYFLSCEFSQRDTTVLQTSPTKLLHLSDIILKREEDSFTSRYRELRKG